jgi:dihydroorotase
MRPGDIHTHVFAQQFPIIDAGGKVYDHMWQARERGIIFDLGHGAASFWFRNAVPAVEQGFVPDSISTDLHTGNVNGPVIDMLECMNKLFNMGLPLADVIARATVNPAREISRPDLGTLSVGSEADVAVLDRIDGPTGFVDCGKERMAGFHRLACAMTFRAGEIVWDPTGLSRDEWKQGPVVPAR